jgi:hypothetical protein
MASVAEKVQELKRTHRLSDAATSVLQLHAAEPTAPMFFDRYFGKKTVKRSQFDSLKGAYRDLAAAGLVESSGSSVRIVCEGELGDVAGESVSFYSLTAAAKKALLES